VLNPRQGVQLRWSASPTITADNHGYGHLTLARTFPRNNTMKTRSLLALLGLVISFALPIFGQDKEDVKPFPFTPIPAGPARVQQIEAIDQKFDEALTSTTQPLSVRSTSRTRFKSHQQDRFPVERLSKDILRICFSVTIQPIELQR
jgi:hypothetical protein